MSSKFQPVYTEKTRCRDCYKCVRNCPVKAIKVEDNSARIIHELCIFCGRCVYVCPNKAKKVRSDLDQAKELIRSGEKVILSLAPSWSTGLLGDEQDMLKQLGSLGFYGVSETAIGAELVSQSTIKELELQKGLSLSSACPSMVELFRKYFTHLLPNLSRQPSPLEAHGHFLKKFYGEDVRIIFAGPCIAKKLEADDGNSPIDLALTFDELISWIDEENTPLDCENTGFIPWRASNGSLYAMEGGMINSLNQLSPKIHKAFVPLSGVKYIMDALEEVDVNTEVLLELLSCPGGCVNGSGIQSSGCQFNFRKNSLEHFQQMNQKTDGAVKELNLSLPLKEYTSLVSSVPVTFDEDQILKALEELGKKNDEDHLDCGGCGYNSCRDFAVSCLQEMGEPQMCVTNMRRQAQRKVDMLLKTLPMGIVIVNREYRIVECNSQFAGLFAHEETICDDDYVLGHKGMPLNNFIDLMDFLDATLSGENKLRQETIKQEGKFLKISSFSIETGNLAGVILQDITSTSEKREMVIRKAEEVINKNLQNVQQIASLLGENAAETEIILRSLTEVNE